VGICGYILVLFLAPIIKFAIPFYLMSLRGVLLSARRGNHWDR